MYALIENSNFTNFKISPNSRFFTNFKTVNFKIHKIQIITFIAAKFQLKLFDANTALNFWIKNCDVIQDSLTRRQISMITCSLLQSL